MNKEAVHRGRWFDNRDMAR